ncbi:hypothetical protein SAMN02745229_02871 [Butyrivibrio fibrisolvens DSM 3071]|uniref:Dolichyl-phosphate-mannose-protein mannosyltransferase n=1 Tax=Butyrivibrio fibrisolvens DSM 3071 TaxID=1121131 RepID=A0A1M6A3T1_BUTFI|nr:hypothetical protein [Butyrivibrio fibrisolvens]SHI31171.1 hypothetical protein SAMN02745229_02871 [Butyrivibrio fibrisolvens DSM 3071]
MIKKIKEAVSFESPLHVVQIITFTFVIELLLSSIMFLAGLCITWPFFFVSFALSALVTIVVDKEKVSWFEILLSLIIIVFLSWICGLIFDYSYDGNAYHKVAVGLLKNNWNPFFSKPNLSLTEKLASASFNDNVYIESYCKITWIFGASIYAVTGLIETGKSYTLLAMLCSFLLVFYYMRKKEYKLSISFLTSILVMLNPIAVQQIFTFYIDGFLHTIIFMLIIALIMLEDRQTFDMGQSASLVAGLMIICGNIKFTGLLYGGLFCIAFYLYDFYKEFKQQKGISKSIIRETILYFVLVIATVVWGGATTYITNLVRHGSLTYPLTGEGKVDIMTGNSPFTEENHFKNLFISLFSKVDNFQNGSGNTTKFKIPFTFSLEELAKLNIPDARISGFGVIFGGLLIVSVIIMTAWFIKGRNDKKKVIIGLILLVSIALTFGIKESWWARYSPYIYAIVLMAAFVSMSSEKVPLKIAAYIFVVLILFNNCLPLIHTKGYYKDSREADAFFEELTYQNEIEISNSEYKGVYFNFKDYGIYYRINSKLEEDDNVNTTNYLWTKWRALNNINN